MQHVPLKYYCYLPEKTAPCPNVNISNLELLLCTCFIFSVGRKEFQFKLNRIKTSKHHKHQYLFLLRDDSIAFFINCGVRKTRTLRRKKTEIMKWEVYT